MRFVRWGSLALAVGLLGCTGNPAADEPEIPNPFGVPSSVSLPMPATLTTVAPLQQAAAGYRAQGSPPISMAQQIAGNMQVYSQSTRLINTILEAVNKTGLQPDRPFTFPDPGNPTGKLTVLLQVRADHAVISIGEGTSATGSAQVLGISYTSRTKGTAVLRPLRNDPGSGRFILATTYDLDAGRASADGAGDSTVLPDAPNKQKMRAHWEFASIKSAPAASPSFTMKVSAALQNQTKPADSGNWAISSQFLADGSAAAIAAMQTASTADRLMFVPNDIDQFLGAHDFYIGTDGNDLATSSASPTLRGILPADDSLYRPFPTNPSHADPFEDPVFTFPQ